MYVFFADHVRTRGGDPNVAFDVDNPIDRQLFSVRIIGDAFPGIFERDQPGDIDTLGIEDGAPRVAGGYQNRPFLAEEARGVVAGIKLPATFVPELHMHSSALVLGAGLVVALGIVTGAIPAFQAMRLSIVDALRRT